MHNQLAGGIAMKENFKLKERGKDPLMQKKIHKELMDEICQTLKRLDDQQLNIVHRFVRKLAE